ncbi:MAG: sialate O-acetylesterase, partial [Haloferula sp.]
MKKLLRTLMMLVAATSVAAEDSGKQAGSLELAAPFTQNMILQREAEVPVWGFDSPGSQVTVEFAGQKKTAVANKFGDW